MPPNDYSGCAKEVDSISCKKTRSFGQGYTLNISFAFASCNNSKGLHLDYNYISDCGTSVFSKSCTRALPWIQNGWTTGSYGFSALEVNEQLKDNYMPKLVMRSLPYCHKHVSEFLCRSAMPECDIRAGHPKLIFPCAKECNEVRNVCQKLLKT